MKNAIDSDLTTIGSRCSIQVDHQLLRLDINLLPSGGTIDEALACQERKCFVSSGEGVSYPCIFFSRI